MKMYVRASNSSNLISLSDLKKLIKLFRQSEGCKIKSNNKYIKFFWNDGAYLTEYYSIDDILSGLSNAGLNYDDVAENPSLLLYNDSDVEPIAKTSARFSYETSDYNNEVHMYDEKFEFTPVKPIPELEAGLQIHVDSDVVSSDVDSLINFIDSTLTAAGATAEIHAFNIGKYYSNRILQPRVVITLPHYEKWGKWYYYPENTAIIDSKYDELLSFAESLPSFESIYQNPTDKTIYFDFKTSEE